MLAAKARRGGQRESAGGGDDGGGDHRNAAALRRRFGVRGARIGLGERDALQPRPDRDDHRNSDCGCHDESDDRGHSLQACGTVAHAFAHRQKRRPKF